MTQLTLFDGVDRPIHRERDRPKRVGIKLWNWILDLACLKGGVAFTHEALLEDLRSRVSTARSIKELKHLTEVQAMHWAWDWEKRYPWLVAELEARKGGAST